MTSFLFIQYFFKHFIANLKFILQPFIHEPVKHLEFLFRTKTVSVNNKALITYILSFGPDFPFFLMP